MLQNDAFTRSPTYSVYDLLCGCICAPSSCFGKGRQQETKTYIRKMRVRNPSMRFVHLMMQRNGLQGSHQSTCTIYYICN